MENHHFIMLNLSFYLCIFTNLEDVVINGSFSALLERNLTSLVNLTEPFAAEVNLMVSHHYVMLKRGDN